MEEKFNFTHKSFGTTFVHPVALVILAVALIIMFTSPRKYAVWPFIIIACFVAQAQRITVAGLDFPFLRLLVVFGAIRLLIRDEITGYRFNRLDWAVLAFGCGRMLFSYIGKTGGVSAVSLGGEKPGALQTYGQVFDFWGMYFYFRCVVRDFNDLRHAIFGFMVVSIPTAAAFIYEYVTETNLFAAFRGSSGQARSRDGILRCMAAYSHPILGGLFWALLMPYFGAMIKQNGRIKFFPIVAIICGATTIILSGSSTPIAAAGVAFIGGCMFLLRNHMRLIRWGVFLFLVTLQLVMARGAAHVLSRINIVGGSTGYYRFKLIDQFISHWKEWFWLGSSKGTSTWDVPMYDIVNYYVNLGFSGGIWMILLITWVFVRAYKNVGENMRAAPDTENKLLAWATGVAVVVHMISFMVVSYYGQIDMMWYFSLAMTAVGVGAVMHQPQAYGFPVMFGPQGDALSRLAGRPPMGVGYPQGYRQIRTNRM